MTCVILFRINGGPAQVVMSPDDKYIWEFDHIDSANEYATNSPNQLGFSKLVDCGQADYQIVELNEI